MKHIDFYKDFVLSIIPDFVAVGNFDKVTINNCFRLFVNITYVSYIA